MSKLFTCWIFCPEQFSSHITAVFRCLLGDDGDGNSLSDSLDVIAVDRMSGTLLLKPEHINQTSNTDTNSVSISFQCNTVLYDVTCMSN